jgi:hypothetical protein
MGNEVERSIGCRENGAPLKISILQVELQRERAVRYGVVVVKAG